MKMLVPLSYSVSFGRLDAGDPMEWEINLNDEETAAYNDALLLRKPFGDYPILKEALKRAYEEIMEHEFNRFKEEGEETWGDPYRECAGKYPVNKKEIEGLVRSKDQHALKYFKLTNLSDEELASWDVNTLDAIPNVCDFDTNFEFKNPFEWFWSISVRYAEEPENKSINKKEAKTTIKKLFDRANGDYTELNAYIDHNNYLFTGDDLGEIAAEYALRKNLDDYVTQMDIEYIPPEKITYDACLNAVKRDPNSIKYVPERFKTQEICEEVFKQSGSYLEFVPDEYKTDEMCAKAVETSPIYFKYVPDQLKSKDICIRYLQRVFTDRYSFEPEKMDDIPLEHKDEAFYRAILDKAISFLPYVPEVFVTEDDCKKCVDEGKPLKWIPDRFKTYELCSNAIAHCHRANEISSVPRNLIDKELCLLAIEQSRDAFGFIPRDMLDEDICMAFAKRAIAFKNDIERIPPQFLSQEICLEIIERDPFAFKDVPDRFRSEELCLKVLSDNPAAIRDIPESLRTKEFYEKAKKEGVGVLRYIPEEFF